MVLQICLALPAWAGCQGRDLLAALAAPERQALDDRLATIPHASGNLWRASRGDAVIHLVGTYHLPDPRHDSMLDRLAPLLDSTERLLVEATPAEQAQMQAAMAKDPTLMVRPEGPALQDLLEPAEWQQLSSQLRAHGVPGFMAQRMRPWYVATMLGVPACAMDGVRTGQAGLDHRLMQEAVDRGIPLAALEPHDTALKIFTALSPGQELDLIRAALLTQQAPEDELTTMSNAYFAGQSWLFWEFTNQRAAAEHPGERGLLDLQMQLFRDQLMNRRNQAWVPVILEALPGHGTLMVAAGALHLPGDQGLLALLAAEGFAITRLDQ